MLVEVNYKDKTKSSYRCDKCNKICKLNECKQIYTTGEKGNAIKKWDLCFDCYNILAKFVDGEEEKKPILLENEREILRSCFYGGQNVIFRDCGGDLWTRDVNGEDNYFGQFNYIFQFIKDGGQYEIKQLLDN